MVMAGVMDGTSEVCDRSSNKESSSVVTKHAGKAFGACAAANAATRNGLARWALGRGILLDDTIRLFDCLAALPKVAIFSVNQLGLEKEVRFAQPEKPSRKEGKDGAGEGWKSILWRPGRNPVVRQESIAAEGGRNSAIFAEISNFAAKAHRPGLATLLLHKTEMAKDGAPHQVPTVLSARLSNII